jgi:hypothetical protein
MHLRRISPLAALVFAGGLILVAGCANTNHNPVISSIATTPTDSVTPGGAIKLTAVAVDEDGDALAFSWSVTGGTLAGGAGDSITWTAPATAGSYTATCIADDGNDGADTATQIVKSYIVWRLDDVQGTTPDSTYLPVNSTTLIPFTFDDIVPDGAVIESAFVTTDLEPDTTADELLQVSVITPGGSEAVVYDGINGEPDVDGLLLQGIKDGAAKGTWYLKVVRSGDAFDRWVEPSVLDLCYRY